MTFVSCVYCTGAMRLHERVFDMAIDVANIAAGMVFANYTYTRPFYFILNIICIFSHVAYNNSSYHTIYILLTYISTHAFNQHILCKPHLAPLCEEDRSQLPKPTLVLLKSLTKHSNSNSHPPLIVLALSTVSAFYSVIQTLS